MMASGSPTRGERGLRPAAIAALALLAALAIGIPLRLEDPLAREQITAEDPYTHIVYTKEALDQGTFDESRLLGLPFYPPGLHVLLGVAHEATGASYQDLARFLPPILFGALGIAGVFVAGRRLGGLAAGAVAAVAIAAMPEHVFRTNILTPTGLDLALIPLLLLATSRVMDGAYAWVTPLLVAGAAMVFAHPWAVPLTAVGVGLFVCLRVIAASPGEALRTIVNGVLTLALFGALSGGSALVPNIEGHYDLLFSRGRERIVTIALLASAALVALLFARLVTHPLPPFLRGPLRVGAIAGLVAVGLPRITSDLPRFVDYDVQLGFTTVGFALAGLALLPAAPSRLGLLGAGVALGTFPMTAINVFNSPYWPHRSVAYLTIGVALLAGAAAAAGLALAERAFPAPAEHAPRGRRVSSARTALALGVALALSGAVVANAPSPYEWYRLYDEASYEGMAWAVGEMAKDPSAAFAAGHWKSHVLLKALGDETRVYWASPLFESAGSRDYFLGKRAERAETLYLVVDPGLKEDADANAWGLGFLESSGWSPVGTWGNVTIYRAPARE